MNTLYRKYTGISADIEKMISDAKTDEHKGKLLEKLSWSLRRGIITDNADSDITKQYVELLTQIAEALQITEAEDANKDSVIDSKDEQINKVLEQLDDLKSEIDVETSEEPSDEPSEEPTEEVTDKPSEEPSEEPTE